MESEWKPVMLEVMPYKETGTFIMKVSDDCSQLLDDHIVMAQSMSFSPYKKPFEERITTWESKLVMTQDVMDEWLQCQRQWLYLEPIFSSEDINRQLPVESKRYQTMERIWRKVMNNAKGNPQVKRRPLSNPKTLLICSIHLESAVQNGTLQRSFFLELSFEPFRTGNLCLDLSVQRNSCGLIAWGWWILQSS